MSSNGSLPACAICSTNIAIYRCPRCHTCTCSLECCRAHKLGTKNGNGEEIVCNGKRDRTKFCSLKGFTDSQLSSDYHFLEDVLKVSESSKRLYHGIATGCDSSNSMIASDGAVKRARGSTNNTFNSGKVELDSISTKSPVHPLLQAKEGKNVVEVLAHGVDDMQTNEQQLPHQGDGLINELLVNKPVAKPTPPKRGKVDPLVRQAELKGVNLLRMPNGMERRRSNTTKFNKKKGIITWKIELCFYQPKDTSYEGGSNGSAEKPLVPKMLKVESEVSESSTLSEELGKHLDVHPGNATTRSRLRMFSTAPRGSFVFFMKRLPCSSAAPQYFKLDPDAALVESLKGKTIIEFPTIDVVLEADIDRFPLFIGEVS